MKQMERIRFGVIGGGMMGREFACAALRWPQLKGNLPRPVVTAVCSRTENSLAWFRQNTDATLFCQDYRELLQDPEVDAVYCAVPHHLHEAVYRDVILSGKHLLGEKPFGIDLQACQSILNAMRQQPEVFVRVASEFAFFPAVWQMMRMYEEGRFGAMIEASFTMKHSSDLQLDKPINWKRVKAFNGEYGCMGDLGIHTQHVPFRLGLQPKTVSAQLSKLVTRRPGPDGAMVPCDTWDNAVLLCGGESRSGERFPMRFEMKRMSPGDSNTVEYEILGMDFSARFSTLQPNTLFVIDQKSRKPGWAGVPTGQQAAYPTITGGIFEFGFSDAILQMLAAYVSELRGLPCPLACFTPQEALLSHRVLTAALQSHRDGASVPVGDIA